jgi:hypothetical protein
MNESGYFSPRNYSPNPLAKYTKINDNEDLENRIHVSNILFKTKKEDLERCFQVRNDLIFSKFKF